jgi:hypothetical protein
LIFALRRGGGFGEGDLYISFRTDGGDWSKPVNLGNQINSNAEENRPSVTLDGRHFFSSNNTVQVKLPKGIPPASSMPGNGSRDIYWMTTDFIDRIRKELQE